MVERIESRDGSDFRFSPRPNRANEIDWRPWGREVFSEAEAQGKLVLLSISAVWCHWCHVMDETTYSDPGVIERINRDFIPVRVDSDKRPDVNRRYNQGGWPTTAFLIPSGRAVAGLTYAPPEQLTALLDRMSALYRHRKNDVDTEAAAMSAEERELAGRTIKGGEVDPGTSTEVEAAVLASWDREYGGLGDAPKFPQAEAVEFALAGYVEAGSSSLISFARSTLDAMKDGEMNDAVEGGFFRYATARDWSTPHFEKMLADNAELARLYLAAAQVLNEPAYADTARSALDYSLRTLMDDEQRGFFGSQDADEEYYRQDAAGRAGLEPPAVDRTIYTDSSSKMLSALVLASAVLEDPGLLGIAERVADFIWREGFRHGSGLCHYFELPQGLPALWGQPEDQVSYLQALIDLYQATADARFLERAVELGDIILEHYVGVRGWIGEDPGLTGEGHAATSEVLDDMPADMPDIRVNGAGARGLLSLDVLAPGRGYDVAAGRALEALAGRYRNYTYFAAGYALAVELLRKGFIEVRVSPEAGPELRKELTSAAVSAYHPRKLVRLETLEDYMPTEDGTAPPPAILCSPGSCLPAGSPAELIDSLISLAGAGGHTGTS